MIYTDTEVDLADKEALLKAEMAIDYSDVDELQKIRALACLPDAENKASLWNHYVDKT